MPSRWVIGVELADGEPVDARFLHAVVATWLDDVESHAKNDKGWAISPMRASAAGGAAFEVALIDDGLLARFETASSRPTIRVGSRTVKLVDPAEGQRATASCAIRLLRRRSLAELIREAQPAWKWEINFVTPTAFRRGDIGQPMPTGDAVLRSMLSAWPPWCPLPMTADASQRTELLVDRIEGTTELFVPRDRPIPGFVGTIRYRLPKPDPETGRQLDGLFRLAEFAGIGAHTTFGMGVVEVRSIVGGQEWARESPATAARVQPV